VRFIAFLRAINVGGHTVTMAELQRHFTALDLQEVETFIASGNVVFRASTRNPTVLERRIEDHLLAVLGYEVKTFLRTEAEVAAIARYQPFTAEQRRAAATLNVGFLSGPLAASARKALMGLKTAIDDFHLHGRELYWMCRKRQNESTFTNVRFERVVKVRTTFRGVNTIARLADKYGLA
jgi:uncharacterized protein (DUF1697 family)